MNNIPSTTGKIVFDLKDNDVLLGRGNGVNYRAGNIRLRELAHDRALEFCSSTTRVEKYQIIQDILDMLATTDSRLLRPISMDSSDGKRQAWEIVGMSTAVSKVKQVLRDRALLIKANGNDATKDRPRKIANYDRNTSPPPLRGRDTPADRSSEHTMTGRAESNLRIHKFSEKNEHQLSRVVDEDMFSLSHRYQQETRRIDRPQLEQQLCLDGTGRTFLEQQSNESNMRKNAIIADLLCRYGVRSAFPSPSGYRSRGELSAATIGSFAVSPSARLSSFNDNDDQLEKEPWCRSSRKRKQFRDPDESAAWIDSLIEESQKETRLLLERHARRRGNQHLRDGQTGGAGGGF